MTRARTTTILAVAATLLAASAAAETSRMRGQFVHGQQVSFFEPCGVDEAMWVLLEGESSAQLVRSYRSMTTSEYEGVYAEIRAERRENTGAPGVPEEYDALLAVDAVYEVRPMPQPDC